MSDAIVDELRGKAAGIAEMRNRPEDEALVIQISRHTWDDCLDVADGLLGLLPAADDGEPLTNEWLEAVGFVPGKFPDDLLRGPILRGVIRNAQSPADGDWHWAVRSYPIPAHMQPRTRGDLRRLCRCLGVPLA